MRKLIGAHFNVEQIRSASPAGRPELTDTSSASDQTASCPLPSTASSNVVLLTEALPSASGSLSSSTGHLTTASDIRAPRLSCQVRQQPPLMGPLDPPPIGTTPWLQSSSRTVCTTPPVAQLREKHGDAIRSIGLKHLLRISGHSERRSDRIRTPRPMFSYTRCPHPGHCSSRRAGVRLHAQEGQPLSRSWCRASSSRSRSWDPAWEGRSGERWRTTAVSYGRSDGYPHSCE